MKEKDKEASMEKCWATLKQLEASLQHKLQNGIYATEGGYITYQQDFQTILDQYNERKDLGNQVNNISSKQSIPSLTTLCGMIIFMYFSFLIFGHRKTNANLNTAR